MTDQLDTLLAFHALPLHQKMFVAADVLVLATERYHDHGHPITHPSLQDWRPANLRSVAMEWRQDDERKDAVEALAKVIYQEWPLSKNLSVSEAELDAAHARCRSIATRLIEAGWAKQDA